MENFKGNFYTISYKRRTLRLQFISNTVDRDKVKLDLLEIIKNNGLVFCNYNGNLMNFRVSRCPEFIAKKIKTYFDERKIDRTSKFDEGK